MDNYYELKKAIAAEERTISHYKFFKQTALKSLLMGEKVIQKFLDFYNQEIEKSIIELQRLQHLVPLAREKWYKKQPKTTQSMEALQNLGEWKVGNHLSNVVSDSKVVNNLYKDYSDDKINYGGYLICESVPNADLSKLISAAPEMYKAVKCARAILVAQGIDEKHAIVGELFKQIDSAIFKAEGITQVDFEEIK